MDDVLIVGTGLAGSAAALRLADAGLSAMLVEARGRTGGRAYSRPLTSGSSDILEFGGSWITPWHDRLRDLAKRFNVSLRPTDRVRERRWHDGQVLRTDAPVSDRLKPAFDRVLEAIGLDARRVKQDPSLLDVGGDIDRMSFVDYLASKGATPEVVHEVMAWWIISGSASPETVSAADLLHFSSHHDGSLDGMMAILTHTIEGGAGGLVQRMIHASRADVVTGDPVTVLEDCGSHVVARLSSGRSVTARRAIAAVALNALRTIRFSPQLRAEQTALIAAGHNGRAIKMLMRVSGVEPGILVTGEAEGLRWMFSERKLGPGATAVIGFGLYDQVTDTSHGAIQSALQRFFPEATLLAHDWHDWARDPFSSGTWVSPALGTSALYASEHWAAQGRIGFATSDTAASEAGWYEGAVRAGEAAADEAIAALRSMPAQPQDG